MRYFGEQEKESIIRVRMGYKNQSLATIDCHHSASLLMPIGDPRHGFFYPTLILVIYSYGEKFLCNSNCIDRKYERYLNDFLKQ